MEAESFFARWEKRNAEKRAAEAQQPEAAQPAQPAAEETPRPPPTLEDVAGLTPDSDFKPFVARGVDENVRRSAMKKLFADPHFNVMDGLDIYIEDYNKFEPIPAQVLGALNHAQALLDPLRQLQHPVMRLIDSLAAAGDDAGQALPADETGEQDDTQEQAPPQADDGGAENAPPQTEGQQDNDHPI
ncbi:DUF3306 domain-containing protein [Noviherbaspirillum aridicola]|uniref:DUF3306 domain-containing protein n=1 Tax=Noviherbaspirillum aridicola TaxID=2849687 RepID=A0ABQ4Q4E8_9BURK|nr:DUF3306 domain-containing protein [Noviherbaspirillum aridicola]GIZ52065.1 hypothetical protein NCCP691_20790 [Noviherbaspirillum aridicola]